MTARVVPNITLTRTLTPTRTFTTSERITPTPTADMRPS